jgi:Ni/Co efflux regulator RcnB
MKRLSFIIGMVAALTVAAADASAQGRRDRGDRGGRGWDRGGQSAQRMDRAPRAQPMPRMQRQDRYRGEPNPYASGRYREVERYQQQQQRSWNRGDRLPPGYGARVPNPGAYRLRQPPPGYNWVQNGRDLYLMQQGTGLVLDAIPGGGY